MPATKIESSAFKNIGEGSYTQKSVSVSENEGSSFASVEKTPTKMNNDDSPFGKTKPIKATAELSLSKLISNEPRKSLINYSEQQNVPIPAFTGSQPKPLPADSELTEKAGSFKVPRFLQKFKSSEVKNAQISVKDD